MIASFLCFLAFAVQTAAGFSAPVSTSRTAVSMRLKSIDTLNKIPATALCISTYAQATSAKSVLGVNGALDFGPLAGDQPGGEGTGKALGVNDDALFGVLLAIPVILGVLFAQWQGYQDDDDDFFDTYDSRRTDKELTNRNRV